jgi:hypothetical protein
MIAVSNVDLRGAFPSPSALLTTDLNICESIILAIDHSSVCLTMGEHGKWNRLYP